MCLRQRLIQVLEALNVYHLRMELVILDALHLYKKRENSQDNHNTINTYIYLLLGVTGT